MVKISPKVKPVKKDMVITRVFNEPRELVFKVWADPKHVARWWGPHGFTTPVCKMDVCPGGALRIDMKGPDGTVYPMTGVFKEVVPPERLVYTSTPLDKKGKPLFEVLQTVTFGEQGKKTKLTWQAHVVMETAEAASYLAGMEPGCTQTLERLAEHLTKISR